MAAAPASPLRRVGRTIKSFLLWSHERGSWQYDVMVALIVAFVLLTPVRYFRDWPAEALQAGDLRLISADADGLLRYRVSAHLFARYDERNPQAAAEDFFMHKLGHPVIVARIEPTRTREGAIAWYDVWLRE